MRIYLISILVFFGIALLCLAPTFGIIILTPVLDTQFENDLAAPMLTYMVATALVVLSVPLWYIIGCFLAGLLAGHPRQGALAAVAGFGVVSGMTYGIMQVISIINSAAMVIRWDLSWWIPLRLALVTCGGWLAALAFAAVLGALGGALGSALRKAKAAPVQVAGE